MYNLLKIRSSSIAKLLYLAVGIFLLYFTYKVIKSQNDFNLLDYKLFNIYMFILFQSSHFFRALRLYILNNNFNLSFTDFSLVHYFSNGLNLLIPFRLGEAIRYILIVRIIKKPTDALIMIIIERASDFSIIFLVLIFLYFFSINNSPIFFSLILISILCIIFLLTVIFFLSYPLKKFKGELSHKFYFIYIKSLFRFLENMRDGIKNVSSNLSNRKVIFLHLSVIIWLLEASVFYILINDYEKDIFIILTVFVYSVLSTFLPSGPAGIGGIQLAFFYVATSGVFDIPLELSFVYIISTFVPSIILTIIIYPFIKRVIYEK